MKTSQPSDGREEAGTTRTERDPSQLQDYIWRMMANAKDDSLERAECAFLGLTPAQMQQEHGASGQTRQQILDGYRIARRLHNEAVEYLESLFVANTECSQRAPRSPKSEPATTSGTQTKGNQ